MGQLRKDLKICANLVTNYKHLTAELATRFSPPSSKSCFACSQTLVSLNDMKINL